MKVLWITNIPVGEAGLIFYNQKTSGLWMDVALEDFKYDNTYELYIATCGNIKNTKVRNDENITYYLLPDKVGYEYHANKKSNLDAIHAMLGDVQPDIIHFWGTENQLILDIITCNQNKIPMLVYIQGVVNSLDRYFTAGLTTKEIIFNTTIMDVLKGTGIYNQIKRYKKQSLHEKSVVIQVKNIVGENIWSKAYYKAICKDVKFYDVPLYINQCFKNYQWNIETVTQYSIMCNSASYSIKGLHMLLKAIALLKTSYPTIKLYVPGDNPVGKSDFKSKIRYTGYIKYLNKLIAELDLLDSIVFLPFLTPDQMAEQMMKSHVYVVPSAIENHSSSLKEAMLVGIPSIGTYVGGVSEYVKHGENGYLYRFEEPEVLAYLISNIFNSNELANKLSINGKKDMIDMHFNYNIHKRMKEIYKHVLGEY